MGFFSVFFIFIIIVFILLAIIPYYKRKTKSKAMKIYAIIYNLIFGFYDYFFLCALSFVAGGSTTKAVIDFILLYLMLLIPINIVFKVRGKINIKKYLIISILATLAGFALYCVLVFITELMDFNII